MNRLWILTICLTCVEFAAPLRCSTGEYGRCNCTGRANATLTRETVRDSCKLSTYLTWECANCTFDGDIASDAFRVYDLANLRLTCGTLTKLTDWTTNLNGVVELSVANNRLTTLYNGTFRRGNKLQRLDVSGNRLQTIERLFLINCTALESFDVSRNRLTALTKGVCFTQVPLRRLDASGNAIDRIDENALFSCTQLRRLSLADNRLRQLTKNDLASEALYELDVSGNALRGFKADDFAHATNLVYLNLSRNVFEDFVGNDEFGALVNLERLDLGRNKMTRVTRTLFANNRKLLQLVLSGNDLKEIERGAFDNLRNLQALDLDRNQLTALDIYAFVNLASLKRLRLNDNKFVDLDLVPYVKHNARLTYLTLHNNQFNCSTLHHNLMELKKVSVTVQPGPDRNGLDGIACLKDDKETVDPTTTNSNGTDTKGSNAVNLEDIKALMDRDRGTTHNLLIATLFFVVVLLIAYTYANCNLPINLCKFRPGYNDIELINEN